MSIKASYIHSSFLVPYKNRASLIGRKLFGEAFSNALIPASIFLTLFGAGLIRLTLSELGAVLMVIGFLLLLIDTAYFQDTSYEVLNHTESITKYLWQVAETPGDKSYVDALLAVGNATSLERPQIEEITHTLNRLLTDYIALESQRKTIKNVIRNQSSDRLRLDLKKTEFDIDSLRDASLLKQLEQNRTILKSQILKIQALELDFNRIESQQREIIDAFEEVKRSSEQFPSTMLVLNPPATEKISTMVTPIPTEARALNSFRLRA